MAAEVDLTAHHMYQLDKGEGIIEVFESDLTLEGLYSSGSRAVLTDRRLIVIDASHPEGHLSIPFGDIREMTLHSYYGNSTLRIEPRVRRRPIHRDAPFLSFP